MQPKISILIIDDDAAVCDTLTDIFDEHGYHVQAVQNGKDALIALQSHQFALILLNLILPDLNGLMLLQKIKSLTDTPVIMLSGVQSESDIVVGLEMGADDYIGKPFKARETVARVKAVLRRMQPQHFSLDYIHQGFVFQGWVLDTALHQLFSPQKQAVPLTQGEYALLHALVSHAQKGLSRQKLLELTHNENFEIFDRTIDVLIMRLRKKLEPNPRNPTFIQTIRGTGYLFNCPVEKTN